jgi:NAD(P)H-nitrite reductase large subunit
MNSKERQIIEGLKIICKCKNIRKRDFLKHIKAGITTVEDLQKATGAGSGDCKGKNCTPRIADLLASELGQRDR